VFLHSASFFVSFLNPFICW